MSEKKHIDRVFQEKLKDLEINPDHSIWDKIDESLSPNKKKRKVIPIWWKLGGIAASLILLFTIGRIMFKDEKPTIVNIKTEEIKELKKVNDTSITESSDDANKVSATNSIPEDSYAKEVRNSANSESPQPFINQNSSTSKTEKYFILRNKKETIVSDEKQNPNINNKVSKNSTKSPISENEKEVLVFYNSNEPTPVKTKDKEITAIETEKELVLKPDEKEKQPIKEGLAFNDEETDEKEKEPINRWQINPTIAPVYFNSLGKGSSIDGQFNNNPKSGNINMSYGLSASYSINKKLSIRSGVNLLKISYDTENILALQSLSSNASAQNFRYIKLNSVSNVMFLNANNVSLVHVPNELATDLKAQLNQELGFVEIPLELKYNFIDKKIGINMISGFSFLFLSDNNVYSVVNDDKTLLGEATNIKNTSFSANFGLGFDYNISKSINLNIDPIFKYQINTFNDTSGDFKPYVIGIYSGVNIKF